MISKRREELEAQRFAAQMNLDQHKGAYGERSIALGKLEWHEEMLALARERGDRPDSPAIQDEEWGKAKAGAAVKKWEAELRKLERERDHPGRGTRKDGETLFQRCEAWRELAEHVAQSLDKGNRVIARGRVKANTWTGKDGEQRTATVLDVDAIGPELRWATATVQRVHRTSAPAAAAATWESGDGLVVGESSSGKQTFLKGTADGHSGSTVATSAKDELASDHSSES